MKPKEDPMQQSLRIKIDRVTYANQTNGFVVIRGKGGTSIRNTQDVTAVGILPDAMSTLIF